MRKKNLTSDVSLEGPRFQIWSFHIGFLVNRAMLEQVFLGFSCFCKFTSLSLFFTTIISISNTLESRCLIQLCYLTS